MSELIWCIVFIVLALAGVIAAIGCYLAIKASIGGPWQ